MVTRHKKRASAPVPRLRRSALRSSRKSRGTDAEMTTGAVLTRELDEARHQQVAISGVPSLHQTSPRPLTSRRRRITMPAEADLELEMGILPRPEIRLGDTDQA